MKIYIIRHGETTGDVEDRYGGAYDDHLTPRGVSEVKELTEKVSSFGIERIFTSTLIRAKETTAIINEKLKVEVEDLPGMRERNLNGILSGMVRAEAKEKYPDLVEKLKDYRNTIEGAESYDDSRKRMIEAFQKVANSGNKIVAIITHGGPIKSVFRELLGREVDTIADCGFAELDVSNGVVKFVKADGIRFK